MGTAQADGGNLLGAADIRRIAAEEGITPTKKFGQNFVIDPGTVRKIVREAGVDAGDQVMEVGPGLGSLTLAILETGRRPHRRGDRSAVGTAPAADDRRVHAECDQQIPCGQHGCAQGHAVAVAAARRRRDVHAGGQSALQCGDADSAHAARTIRQSRLLPRDGAERGGPTPQRTAGIQGLRHAERELAWYGHRESVGNIGRNVFWPAPNVDSALVRSNAMPQTTCAIPTTAVWGAIWCSGSSTPPSRSDARHCTRH